MKRLKTTLIWVVGISFIIIGALKYVNLDPVTRPVFDRAGLPKWFFHAIGAVEFTAGFLMIMTATSSRRLGSILIALVMLGAIGARYILHEPLSHFLVPGAVLIFAILTILNAGEKKSLSQ